LHDEQFIVTIYYSKRLLYVNYDNALVIKDMYHSLGIC